MATTGKISIDRGDLRVTAYPGDNMVLLAMSLADGAVNDSDKNLAGFAVWRTVQGKAEEALLNLLNFDDGVHQGTTPAQRKWTESSAAPFQKFRWVDVPPDGFDVPISYRVMAKYFTGQGKTLKDGPQATIQLQPPQLAHAKFRIAFTRGYASSQAYAVKFHNADIRPPGPKTAQFDTTPFTKNGQYPWLGADAYKHLFAFFDECRQDTTAKIDVFAYDLDEPDVIKAICDFGKQGRLRAVLDNASLHTKKGAVEIEAAQLIIAAAGAANVKQGHFNRFQHNKVLIKRDSSGKAQKVLFGSMNFSLRGIFVEANNVMVVDDPTTAGYFATAFDNAFNNKVNCAPFATAPIAAAYNPISTTNTSDLPIASVALSPHSTSAISLGPAATAIHQAQSSIFFAVMAPTGTGPVLNALVHIAESPTIFSYGTVESDHGIQVQRGDGQMGDLTPFSFLKDKVPPPFQAEWSGGVGMHIHHKFIVIDFNGAEPMVFTGSSNLAAGGEEANGDSLIMIDDPVVASIYGIEAVQLFDHYAFQRDMAKATTVTPLSLWYPGKPGAPVAWWKSSYDKKQIKFRDRYLFADLKLPAGVETVKSVNWDATSGTLAAGGSKPAATTKPAGKAAKGTAKGEAEN
jgi:phosphatidylserine/phosphatidylglycerophosphate/cardiolipin synthase-like enzyme